MEQFTRAMHSSCDAPPTKRLCSRGVDLLTLSDINIYRINKHLIGIQTQVNRPPPV